MTQRDRKLASQRIEAEKLDAITADGKVGDESFREIIKEEEKQAQEIKHNLIEEVEKKIKDKVSYNQFLASLLVKELDDLEVPQGWSYAIHPNETGVIMEIQSPIAQTIDGKPRIFRSAFRSTGDGVLDLNAVQTYSIRAFNTIERIKKELHGGLILT